MTGQHLLVAGRGRPPRTIKKLHPVLKAWCTYFRAGNGNRVFHEADWAVRSEMQLWLRRKHQCDRRTAKKRWNYLEGLRRKPPEERRAESRMRENRMSRHPARWK